MNVVATKKQVTVWGTYDEWRHWLRLSWPDSETDAEVLDGLRARALDATTELEAKLRKSLGLPTNMERAYIRQAKKRGKRA